MYLGYIKISIVQSSHQNPDCNWLSDSCGGLEGRRSELEPDVFRRSRAFFRLRNRVRDWHKTLNPTLVSVVILLSENNVRCRVNSACRTQRPGCQTPLVGQAPTMKNSVSMYWNGAKRKTGRVYVSEIELRAREGGGQAR